jgi:putative membrane protein
MLTTEQRTRIEGAIRDCEQKTSSEIVVAHLKRSDSYLAPRLVTAVIVAAVAASALLLFVPALPSAVVIATQAPIAALVFALLTLPPLHRLLAGASAMANAVDARAAQLFSTRQVHATRDRTGVLIMLSQLERRVVIKADIAIDKAVGGDGAWQKQVATIISATRQGDPAAGIVQVIGEIATALADKFPRRPDDTNELPDSVVDG